MYVLLQRPHDKKVVGNDGYIKTNALSAEEIRKFGYSGSFFGYPIGDKR